jgi:phage tail sheath protein FI
VPQARVGPAGLGLTANGDYGAIYFPALIEADPLRKGQLDYYPPSGAVAGVIAQTDTNRGVWKAPAGIAAGFVGVQGFRVLMTDDENGELNPFGVNCLRKFPNVGNVVWGARTLRGADTLSDDYKYLPVRRLALYIEESLFRGTKWVVFEPNDEPLWAQIRLNVQSFMQNQFTLGAFAGRTPKDAYLVKCDSETTTPYHQSIGVVNIVVGFAPLRPAEFVVLQIEQLAGLTSSP